MTSVVEICNLALQKIGAGTIVSLADNADEARVMSRLYTPTLRAFLRSHPWSCAIKRAQIASDETAPAFGPAYAYTLPADCVRILPDATVTDWQVEGKKILTDDDGPLDLRYVAEVADPNKMDDLFVQAFACRLAAEACERLTQNNEKRKLAWEEHSQAIREARRINAIANVSQEPPEDPWLTARR